jgi:hypothetical protein
MPRAYAQINPPSPDDLTHGAPDPPLLGDPRDLLSWPLIERSFHDADGNCIEIIDLYKK